MFVLNLQQAFATEPLYKICKSDSLTTLNCELYAISLRLSFAVVLTDLTLLYCHSIVLMTSFDLLAAAFSASSGRNVRFDNQGDSVLLFHEATAIGGPVGRNNVPRDTTAWNPFPTPKRRNSISSEGSWFRPWGDRRQSSRQSTTSHVPKPETYTFTITLKILNGHEIRTRVRSSDTVYSLKKVVQNKERTPVEEVQLQFAGRLMKDHRTLAHYNLRNGSCLYVVLRQKEGLWDQVLAKKSLAPEFDFDFTNVKDDGRTFIRGGEPYRRPYGWKRFALRVNGKYEDDVWLGDRGQRTSSSNGEWPVSYHGTSEHNAKLIADVGYDLTKGKRFAFGHGIYSTPELSVAETYATRFEHEGKTYLMVLQNRVNPSTLKKVHGNDTKLGEYWISPDQADVRPYGVLVKEVSLN